MTCSTCAWWSNTEPSMATGIRRPNGANPQIGICRRAAPILMQAGGVPMTRFPETHADRGCGQWTGKGSGPDDGERAPSTVTPFRKAA